MKIKNCFINITIILGFMLIISSNVFVQQLSNLDEIWIYNFGRCILNGLLPYKDFSIIITPLFAYISAFFLRVFGNEMVVLRFAEIIQTALILFMVYKVLDRLKVNKGVSLLFAMGLYYLYYQLFSFDYNWAVLLASLIILYMELKEEKQNVFDFKRNLILGMLTGVTILLKQTSGIILATIVIGYKLFEFKSFKSIKDVIDVCLTRLLGVLLPILFFAIYLTVNNIWTEFIDYTILGIKTFSNTVPYSKLFITDVPLAYAIPVFLAIIVITSLVTLISKKLRNKDWAKNIRTLMFFDIATAVVVYPISDRVHFAVATVCTLLTVMYLVNVWFVYGLKVQNEKIKAIFNISFKVIAIIIFIVYIAISMISTIKYINNIQNKKYLTHFKYIETDEKIYDALLQIQEYIINKNKEGKDVIILDSMASAINIPIDKYYKNYDMFNLGNFGASGTTGIIEDLKFRKNVVYLVKEEKYKKNWQHPGEVIDYVRNNFKHIERIGTFDVYSR